MEKELPYDDERAAGWNPAAPADPTPAAASHELAHLRDIQDALTAAATMHPALPAILLLRSLGHKGPAIAKRVGLSHAYIRQLTCRFRKTYSRATG